MFLRIGESGLTCFSAERFNVVVVLIVKGLNCMLRIKHILLPGGGGVVQIIKMITIEVHVLVCCGLLFFAHKA